MTIPTYRERQVELIRSLNFFMINQIKFERMNEMVKWNGVKIYLPTFPANPHVTFDGSSIEVPIIPHGPNNATKPERLIKVDSIGVHYLGNTQLRRSIETMVKPVSRETYDNQAHIEWSHNHSSHATWRGPHYPYPPLPPSNTTPSHHQAHRFSQSTPLSPHNYPSFYSNGIGTRGISINNISTPADPARSSYPVHTFHSAIVTPQQQQPSQQHGNYPHHLSYMSLTPQQVASSNATSTSPCQIVDELTHNISNVITTRPPRPYTEYTMFYQLEREYILHCLLRDKNHDSCNSNDDDDDNHSEVSDSQALFKDDPLLPERYRNLPLRADWYISGKSKKPNKRKHRKTHGKIGFLELTRMIAQRWWQVDDETRKYCKMMAAMELVKYKEDMETYNAYKERLSQMGKIPQDVEEREKKKQVKKAKTDKSIVTNNSAEEEMQCAVKKQPPAGGKRVHEKKVVPPDQVLSIPSGRAHNDVAFNSTSGKKIDLDKDMDHFISSLVQDEQVEHFSRKNQNQKPRKHGLEQKHYQPQQRNHSPPMPSPYRAFHRGHHSNDVYDYNDAPWSQYLPGPSRKRQATTLGLPSPIAMTTTSPPNYGKKVVITPERRNKTPKPTIETTTTFDSPTDGRISPEDFIHMTFSGIDENEIAKEFYCGPNRSKSHDGSTDATSNGVSGNRTTASIASSKIINEKEGNNNDAPQKLYGLPMQSFDYWDALVEPRE